MTRPPSKSQILLARIAVALIVGLAVAGVFWYGLSTDELDRVWRNIVARPGGPMTFRFVLQPAMAAVAALRDGVADARLGRTPYLSAILRGVEGRGSRLWEGIVSTARILILGVVMDVVYQLVFLGEFYPGRGGGDRGLAGVRSLCSLARAHRSRCAPLGRPADFRLTDRAFGEGKVGSPDLKLDVNTELAARRTGMAFQRTRLAEDRTLMAVIRTSLSLIGFGFTIYQFFQRLREQDVITRAAAPRHFGLALVALGVLMLLLGIVYHVQFMLGLRRLRQSMRDDGLVHGETIFPVSLTLITAFLLLIVGVAAIVSMEFQVGPFG